MSYPDAWGLKYEEVMSLAWLAYKGHGTNGTWNFPNAGSTWTIENVFEQGSFRAVLVTGRKRILSLSGTDDAGDWVDNIGQGLTGISGQYLRAVHLAGATAPDVVVGHSLGGGMASYCAIYNGRQAATINPAPLNINPVSAVQMFRRHGLVINYVAPGEVLDILDKTMINMKKIGRIIPVSSNGGANPISRHSIANLVGFVEPVKG
ncbi:MAG: hypothetical protein ACR2HG_02810 [Pyrinomonadaceae bacterium]